jgi:hypothetical protein
LYTGNEFGPQFGEAVMAIIEFQLHIGSVIMPWRGGANITGG